MCVFHICNSGELTEPHNSFEILWNILDALLPKVVTFIHDVKIHWKYPLTVNYGDPLPLLFQEKENPPPVA